MNHAIIFDMDGVLVLTEEAHWIAWKAVADEKGQQLDRPTFLSCFGRTNPDCIKIMFPRVTSPAEAEEIADRKEAAFRDHIRHNVPLAPGLRPLLGDLRSRGVGVAIGSSAPPENIQLVLDAGKIREHFGAVADGTEIKRGKPAPDIFLLAASKLKIDPRRCAVVEDAPAGIAAARAAGMLAVGVTTTHTADQLNAAGAHMLRPGVPDLSAALLLEAIDSQR